MNATCPVQIFSRAYVPFFGTWVRGEFTCSTGGNGVGSGDSSTDVSNVFSQIKELCVRTLNQRDWVVLSQQSGSPESDEGITHI